jgi:hypothetical protein
MGLDHIRPPRLRRSPADFSVPHPTTRNRRLFFLSFKHVRDAQSAERATEDHDPKVGRTSSPFCRLQRGRTCAEVQSIQLVILNLPMLRSRGFQTLSHDSSRGPCRPRYSTGMAPTPGAPNHILPTRFPRQCHKGTCGSVRVLTEMVSCMSIA